MTTTRRRSARIQAQSDDDDESSIASSTASSISRSRTTSTRTRGRSTVALAAVEEDTDITTPVKKSKVTDITPGKKSKVKNNKTSLESVKDVSTENNNDVTITNNDGSKEEETPSRRTRSRTRSDASDRVDTPVKLPTNSKKKKTKKEGVVVETNTMLEVIPELVMDSPSNNGEGGETKVMDAVVSPKSSTKKKNRKSQGKAANDDDHQDVNMTKDATEGDGANETIVSPRSTTKKKKRKSQGKATAANDNQGDVNTSSPSPNQETVKPTSSSIQPNIITKTPSSIIPTKKPIFESTIHRLRFLKVSPRGILAMAPSPWYKEAHHSHGSDNSTWCTMVPDPAATASGGGATSSTAAPVTHVRKHQLLAISREGGGVEVIDPAERWVAVGIVPGVRERMVDALVWVCGTATASDDGTDGTTGDDTADKDKMQGKDNTTYNNILNAKPSPHLIGASRDGTIFHLNLTTQRQTHVIGSGAGGVFCLTSLCSRGKCSVSCPGYFAAGCEDGTVKIYKRGTMMMDNSSEFQLVSTLPGVGNAVLSLDWVGDGGSGLGGSVIYAGVADGTIRRFDCVTTSSSSMGGSISTGVVLDPSNASAVGLRWKPTLRMVLESRGLRESTKVWALRALSDGTVISGDSFGNVQFWDGLMGTMIQTFSQSENDADVLCLAVSDDEDKVFASGVDTRVMCIQRQGRATSDSAHLNPDSAPIRKWVNVMAHRRHSHDVRALAIVHKKATGARKKMELLISGSIDTRLCTYVANKYKSSRPRIWFNWSSISPISMAKELRLIAVTRSDRVDLYSLGASVDIQDTEVNDETKCLIKTISIKSPFNLTCSAISDDGKFLAASDAATLYVFSLDASENDGVLDLEPTKIRLPKECSRPSTVLRFESTKRLICATIDGPINILQLSSNDDDESAYNVSLEHIFKEHLNEMNFHASNSAVVSLDVSLDGKWMVMMRFSHEKGSVHAFSLDPFGHWWSLPEIESTATCIKLLGESSLAVGCANNSFYIFNLERRELSNWSHDMGLPIVNSLPRQLTARPEPLARILSTPSLTQKLILGSHGFFSVVDLDKTVPSKANTYPPNSLRAKRVVFNDEDINMLEPLTKKKKVSHNEDNDNFTTCLRYSNVLFQDFVNEREMVVVEEPWRTVLEELPAVLARRVYGT